MLVPGVMRRDPVFTRTEIDAAVPGPELPLVERYPGGVDEIVLPLLPDLRHVLGMSPGFGRRRGRSARWYRKARSATCRGANRSA
jgi:hypothetical protein